MREIKFRCWNKNLKKMQFFDGIFNSAPYTEKSNFSQYESCPEFHELILMQYTGLKDKNGKEIYEEDILETVTESIVKVEWNEAVLRLELCTFKNEHYEWLSTFGNEYEVIGNIHENHELLDNK